jgi:hypothetical protein
MQHDPSAPLNRLSELEMRYDGPIPASERRALAFGSAIASEIIEARAEMMFFRAMVGRTRRAGKSWLSRGDCATAAHARADTRLYLTAWRDRRRRLAELACEASARGTRSSDARRILATIPSEIVAPRRNGTRENRP